ncbi:MAG: Oxygen sensor histidine kinase NreB [Syntrophorhabdaceae bacterium PtaU1.Bin034]|nr:MAG: Oxygen sensor histidine kinase NreB [Syntrophorhabdaceae bacterium PtaU1.Bin034]
MPTGRDWAEKAYPDPEYRAKVVAFWKEDRLPEGRGRDVEWRIAGKNGQYKDVEFRVTYLGDKSLVVLTDTTARKRAEEELRAEKQKFQTMTESLPVGIVMMGSDDKIKYINPKFKQLFGYDIADIPNVEDWFLRAYPDPTYRNKALHNWWNNLRSWKPGEGAPYTRKVTCRDNTHKYVNFIPVQLQTNEILLTCEDITESKEAGDKLRERNLELEVLNNIIASVSSSLHLPEILETLKRVFVEKLGIPVGGVFFYNESGNALTMEMSWGVPDRLVSDFETFVLRQYTGETAIHHIPSSRSDDSLFSKFLHRGSSNLRIPLLAKGEIQGMIYLMREAPSFHEDQIAFFKTLGQQVGVIVQNARLFSQVRQSHTQMKALSLQLVEVQEAERRYIARELHDQIGQELTGLKFALEMNVLQSEGKTKAGLMEAQSIVNKLVVLVRELSLKLRPSMLDDLGLLPTLLWHFERFTNQTAIQVTFKHSGCNDERFPREVETTIYRIAQEGLTNVARHAKTDQVIVRLWSDGKTLGIQIEDSGIGFNDAVLNAGLTGGLYGMRERAMLLGGRLTIETRPSAGTRLTAELPINRDDE